MSALIPLSDWLREQSKAEGNNVWNLKRRLRRHAEMGWDTSEDWHELRAATIRHSFYNQAYADRLKRQVGRELARSAAE